MFPTALKLATFSVPAVEILPALTLPENEPVAALILLVITALLAFTLPDAITVVAVTAVVAFTFAPLMLPLADIAADDTLLVTTALLPFKLPVAVTLPVALM